MPTATPTRVLFVCLGNICRSPLAEGLFIQAVNAGGLSDNYLIDSAGTGNYHVGELPDPRTRANARTHGVELTTRARQFKTEDYDRFDHIVVMDRSNEQNVLAKARSKADEAKVRLMRDNDPEPGDGQVPDPWFGGEEGFEDVFQILQRSTRALLAELENTRHPA